MSFKKFDLARDVASIASFVNEVIAVSGSVYVNQDNIKYFGNIASGSSTKLGGYWQTVYDASPTSSLSTALFDATFGYATGSNFNVGPAAESSQNEKIKVYRSFADALLGDKDATFTVNGSAVHDVFFISFKRNIHKDELKKGTVAFTINTDLSETGRAQFTASDEGAVTAFKQDVGGEYAPLKISGSAGTALAQVWYNAGVAIFPVEDVWGSTSTAEGVAAWSGSDTLRNVLFSGTIDNAVDGLRAHIERVDVHNQTNLHSSVYFCRATNTEFNYSSNPTFIDADQRIRVTSGSNVLTTRTYITTIGLYDANDNLLAAAKVNKPIMKSPDSEAVFRLRLDY